MFYIYIYILIFLFQLGVDLVPASLMNLPLVCGLLYQISRLKFLYKRHLNANESVFFIFCTYKIELVYSTSRPPRYTRFFLDNWCEWGFQQLVPAGGGSVSLRHPGEFAGTYWQGCQIIQTNRKIEFWSKSFTFWGSFSDSLKV